MFLLREKNRSISDQQHTSTVQRPSFRWSRVKPGFTLDSPTPYILFITHHTTMSLSDRTRDGEGEIHSLRGNLCRVFEAGCPFWRQTVLHWTSSFLQPPTDFRGKGRRSLLHLFSDVTIRLRDSIVQEIWQVHVGPHCVLTRSSPTGMTVLGCCLRMSDKRSTIRNAAFQVLCVMLGVSASRMSLNVYATSATDVAFSTPMPSYNSDTYKQNIVNN